MNILVIGGSYFLGKTFVNACILACKTNNITVLNRGTRPLHADLVKEIVCDRRNEQELKRLMSADGKKYDVIVDFCAYEKGDIEKIISCLPYAPKQYIFISTVDVYERGTEKIMTEVSPFETRSFAGEAGAYIAGKAALELELKSVCGENKIAYTSLRPAFIFGPDNYAPREQLYFTWIKKAGQVIHPYDATGVFQMVYVDDVAAAIMLTLGNKEAYNQSFNICTDEFMTYVSFLESMERAIGKEIAKVEVSVNDVLQKNLPLPFPLTKEESNMYDGSKLDRLGMKYSDFTLSLKETYEWWNRHSG